MSIKQMTQVWDLDLTHSQQAVLLALADHADDDGRDVFPSVDRTAWKTGYSAREVQRIMKQLRAVGILVPVAPATRRRPVEYALHLEVARRKNPYQRGDEMSPHPQAVANSGVTSETGGVTNEAVRGDVAVSPESSLEPSNETSVRSTRFTRRKTKAFLTARSLHESLVRDKRPAPGTRRGSQTEPPSRWVDRHAERSAETNPLRPANIASALPWLNDA